jgi:hypothetical protein
MQITGCFMNSFQNRAFNLGLSGHDKSPQVLDRLVQD